MLNLNLSQSLSILTMWLTDFLSLMHKIAKFFLLWCTDPISKHSLLTWSQDSTLRFQTLPVSFLTVNTLDKRAGSEKTKVASTSKGLVSCTPAQTPFDTSLSSLTNNLSRSLTSVPDGRLSMKVSAITGMQVVWILSTHHIHSLSYISGILSSYSSIIILFVVF